VSNVRLIPLERIVPTIASSQIPPPKSWDEFEEISLAAAKLRWKSPDFFRNGRQGQRQDGVDIFSGSASEKSIGIQCKNTVSGISISVIDKEIRNAASFVPEIDSLYIATTASRDAVIQKYVRGVSKKRKSSSEFTVEVLFWEDIAGDLCADDAVFFKHYPQFSQRNKSASDHDKNNLKDLTALISSVGVIRFLGSQSMRGFSFKDSELDPLRKFYYEWHIPERKFDNQDLENLRLELWGLADKYLEVIAYETDSCGKGMLLRSVPQDLELTDPERFDSVVEKLSLLANKIIDAHRRIVLKGREVTA
jgi:hypothetical protein